MSILYFVDMKVLRLLSLLLVTLFSINNVNAQELYSASYGDENDPAILFLHGGPGYNSFSFEASTAEVLAKEGFYVVVFDQRGCGRSVNVQGSEYTFEEAVKDIDGLYKKYGLNKATLIGHSWGGALGLVFAEQHPDKVNALVLVGAPMDYQQTFKAIIKNSRDAYKASNKTDQLKYLDMLEQMDTASLQYANYCFLHAMASGQYSTNEITPSTQRIYTSLAGDQDAQLLQNMTQPPVSGFYKSAHYTTLNLINRLSILKKKVKVYGIFGDEDGLFDPVQLNAIDDAIGKDNFMIIKGASHSVFIDQQDMFLQTLEGYIKK